MISRRDSCTDEDLSMYRAARISRDLELTHCAVMYASNLLVPLLRFRLSGQSQASCCRHGIRCMSMATSSTFRQPAKQANLVQLCPYRLVKSLKRLALVRPRQDIAKPLVAWGMT